MAGGLSIESCANLPSSGNGSNDTDDADLAELCSIEIPPTKLMFKYMPPEGYALLAILSAFTVATLVVYIEEIRFILRKFSKPTRKQKTIWILAFFPIFSVTGLLGVFIPRSGTIVDMVANVFFSTCLYNFGRLMVDYMGGPNRMWQLIEDGRMMSLNTPPLCCCCVCLPQIKFERHVNYKITLQVMQVAIVRPILMFLAAVLWTNESYHPGNMSPYNGFIYITILNLISTLVAVYGLMLMRGVFQPELEKQFLITGKIASIQLTLICSALPNLIISALVSSNVIKCGPLFPSKARGEVIYHAFLVFIMLPFALMGRKFYRRASDGSDYARGKDGQTVRQITDPRIPGVKDQTTRLNDDDL